VLTIVSSRDRIAHLDRSLKSRYEANKRPYISRIADPEQHRQPWPGILPGRASDAPESRNLYERRSGPAGGACPAVTFVTVDYFVSANLPPALTRPWKRAPLAPRTPSASRARW